MMRAWLSRLHRALFGTLRRQLVLSVAGVHAVMMVGIVWDLTLRQEQMLVNRLSEQAQVLAGAMATSVAAEVMANDLAGLQQLVEAHRLNPELAYAMVLAPGGRVLAHSEPERVNQWVTDLPSKPERVLLASSIDLADAAAPIVVAGAARGWVRVGLSGAGAQRQLAGIVREGAAYTIAAVLLGVAFAWALGRRMTRRLYAIQGVAGAVRHGEPERRRAPDEGSDEAAELARVFNRMLDRLDRAKSAADASGQSLSMALEAAAMAAWRWKVGAERTDWLEGRERLLGPCPAGGYPDFRDMVLAGDREAFLEAGQRAMAGGAAAYTTEFRLRRTDGTVRWMRATGSIERDASGRAVAITGMTQDITERRLAEQALRESEARASRIIDSSADALVIVDRAGRIVQANERTVEMFGHPLAELVGQSVELLVPEDRREAHVQHRLGFMDRDGGPRWYRTDGMSGLRADGLQFPIQVTLATIGHGGAQQVIATVRDETEARALREELQRHREHLEDLVVRRTAELTVARNEAQRLGQAKSEFLARMSHEIRTPLNGVLGLAQLGRAQIADADAHARFERIEQAGRHLLGVVDDILDFSRLDAGKLEVAHEAFDLRAIVDSAVNLVSHDAQAKHLGFGVSVAPGLPPWVMGDGQRLRQVLVNLLANALKFTAEGEVRMRVAADEGTLYFKVVDTGIGVSKAQVRRLFKPFEQGDSSTTRRFGGSGLGLAISHRLAGLMGGSIAVESAPGKGSAFTLSLPLEVAAAPPAAAAGPPGAAAGGRLQGLRLLVAEDNEVNRLVIEGMLVHEGAEVVLAGDGQEALECVAAADRPFDAVLMDVQMPVMDGLAATRHLARLAPGLPVIAMTAHALQEDLQRCLAAGMVGALTKPLEMDKLVATLRPFVEAKGLPAGAS